MSPSRSPSIQVVAPLPALSPDEMDEGKDAASVNVAVLPNDSTGQHIDVFNNSAQRGLRMRHLQLIAISGAIGSSIFLSVGGPMAGGPLALMIGVCIWASVIWCVNNCVIEMCTLLPVEGGFIHYAHRFLDPAVGFSLGWNYFICQFTLVCNELTVLNVLVGYWDPNLSPAICISVGLALLFAVQVFNVRAYGESEFWISILKIFMVIGAFLFTFITMVGGNPKHDRYGFRFWKTPGVFTADTAAGRAEDIWHALQWGAYAITGPDYISLVAGEVRHPRRVLPKAFNSTTFRILLFYIGGSFAASINAAADDPALLGAKGTGAVKSPYIINMARLGIPILPSVLTASLLIALFSSSSAMAFAASRTLYGLALQSQAPRFLLRTNKSGLPYLCVLIVLLLSCLSYLALSSGTKTVLIQQVLNWLINLSTATQFVTWIAIGVTYLRFRAGIKVQGLGRDFLPVRGRWQPWSAWYVLFWAPFAMIMSGYFIMGPGEFDVSDFLFTYISIFIFIALSIIWKLKAVRQGQRWGWIPAADIDLKTGLPEIEELTLKSEEEWATEPQTKLDRFVNRLF